MKKSFLLISGTLLATDNDIAFQKHKKFSSMFNIFLLSFLESLEERIGRYFSEGTGFGNISQKKIDEINNFLDPPLPKR